MVLAPKKVQVKPPTKAKAAADGGAAKAAPKPKAPSQGAAKPPAEVLEAGTDAEPKK